MAFNQSAWAYMLYVKINNLQCQRLIEKFHIPQRGALIHIVDVDLLFEEQGGKDMVCLQHPWLRSGLPILVNSRSSSKFFGFKDVTQELVLYHSYLDNYHAALDARKKLPAAGGYPARPQTQRQPAVVARPHPSQQRMDPVSETKQAADAPVDLPPPNDPKQIVKPKPFDFKSIVQADGQSADSGPRLSEFVKQNDPGIRPSEPAPESENVTYVDEQGNPLSAEEVEQIQAERPQAEAQTQPQPPTPWVPSNKKKGTPV